MDLAHDHGHHQVAEFLLSKGAKLNNCKKVSMYIQNSIIVYCRAVKLQLKFIDIHVHLKLFMLIEAL